MNLVDEKERNEFEEQLTKVCNTIIEQSNALEHEVMIKPRYNQKKDKETGNIIASYIGCSVLAYRMVWFRLQTNMAKSYRLEFNNPMGIIESDAMDLELKETKDGYYRYDFSKSKDPFKELMKFNKLLAKSYYWLCENEPVDSFGCCSLMEECSDEKKCIQPNIKLAKACQYRQRLLKGKIFYGKNRNIDEQ